FLPSLDLNTAAAVVLAAITCYTDIRERLIYNRHVFPFIALGAVLAAAGAQHRLLISGLLIFSIYAFFYYSRKLLNRITAALGGVQGYVKVVEESGVTVHRNSRWSFWKR
ncbi:MAG: hypothetical protein HPY90_15730, partial [Syntrophothermus sp.]|uniref:prepilin peptidase n=1 Tax=Syntrophothermus sp. TaxID=2736299 RepID=UPI00257B148C